MGKTKRWNGRRCGWLGTGDAKLNTMKNINNLEQRYRYHMNRIGTLMAPHHGSHKNFSIKLLDSIKPDIVFASAGKNNGHGHPHPTVVHGIVARGHNFHTITEEASSYLTERIKSAPIRRLTL